MSWKDDRARQIRDAIREGRKLDAAKLYRELTQSSLEEAMRKVNELEAQARSRGVPGAMAQAASQRLQQQLRAAGDQLQRRAPPLPGSGPGSLSRQERRTPVARADEIPEQVYRPRAPDVQKLGCGMAVLMLGLLASAGWLAGFAWAQSDANETSDSRSRVLQPPSNPAAYPNDNAGSFKMGIYKWTWQKNASGVSIRTAYFGEVRIAQPR